MKRAVKKGKEIILGHIGICILLLCIAPFLFIGNRVFQDIGGNDVRQAPADSEAQDLTAWERIRLEDGAHDVRPECADDGCGLFPDL